MDIAKKLLEDHSRRAAGEIVDYIGSDPDRFRELIAIFFKRPYRLTQRAAWPISLCVEQQPHLVHPHLSRLVNQLPRKDAHAAVKRNIVRLLQFVEIPKRLRGKVFSHCLDLIGDAGEPVAVRCFAITAAARVAEDQPALLKELGLVADSQLEHATAAMKVRIRRLRSGK